MKLEDVIHLYLGQKFIYRVLDIDADFSKPIDFTADQLSVYFQLKDDPNCRHKLVLRKLSDISEEETQEFKKLIPWIDFDKFEGHNRWKYYEHEEAGKHETRAVCLTSSMIGTIPMVAMPYLLSKGFDLFGLIESDQAIEAVISPTGK